MQLKKIVTGTIAAAALCGAFTTAQAAEEQFSALEGIEAQVLSAAEMQAIEGQALSVSALITAATNLINGSKLTDAQKAAAITKVTAGINALAASPRLSRFFKP